MGTNNSTFSDTSTVEKTINKSVLTSKLHPKGITLLFDIKARRIVNFNQSPRETEPEDWKEIDGNSAGAIFFRLAQPYMNCMDVTAHPTL